MTIIRLIHFFDIDGEECYIEKFANSSDEIFFPAPVEIIVTEE